LHFIKPSRSDWRAAVEWYSEWNAENGFKVQENIPEWACRAVFYEVYIGDVYSSFSGTFKGINNLIRKLPNIKELGFDAIQVMPRQYSVTD